MAKDKKRLKILFVCTEDWFFYSHFLPLVKAAKRIDDVEIVLATTTGDKQVDIEKLGVRLVSVDFDRASLRGISAAKLSMRLLQIFRQEQPDIIHFIALKPIVIGGLAARFQPASAKVYHLTGQGFFTLSKNARHQQLRRLFFRMITWFLRRPKSWLLIENPDDSAALGVHGNFPEDRQTILGGAGVDTKIFPFFAPAGNKIMHLAFVGRLVWSKGVDVLIEAIDLMRAKGVNVQLDLYGMPDTDNPRALSRDQLEQWSARDDVTWHGRSENVQEVWRRADVAIVPSRGGEGMPRAMLEAASCARPLIVSDVPGCRHFVRDGQEGFIVPPEDPGALAHAIEALATTPQRRQEMGQAARKRVLDGFTEQHVIKAIGDVYEALLDEERAGVKGEGRLDRETAGN